MNTIFRVRTRREVWRGVVGITLICIVAATAAVLLSVWMITGSLRMALVFMPPAVLIPLAIAPPVSWFAMSIVRLLTQTIERVDAYVRLDTLTGVLSRAVLLDQAREALPRGGSFLMVDADHFKAINDTYGHTVGDEALKRIAEVLRRAAPVDALVGRLGGEEFGIFLPGMDAAEATATAETLCRAMREQGRRVAGHDLALTISLGGAAHQAADTLEATMKRADIALYHAKRAGRDRVHIAAATETMPAPRVRPKIASA
ncbi:GGDEF domain-containing protein [Prosthecodimorpha staleyi]|uniref:diguanylate cyclase n=1 Tax=Prosthecodimorpha staleyi TaxID=2840188 RepID=A0A947GD17_9HYPH|nr:GGDEF domain-containing protein [Prosthecodimorpha staleyi]MBT9292038.1 GGDEF domain-containing protein [Prosthecodimorpha staleyi]